MEENQIWYYDKTGADKIVNYKVEGFENVPEFTDKNYKIVYYPDCQQLILWLPDQGKIYDEINIVHMETGSVFSQNKVSDVLNGSIQIIINTLPMAPGEYEIFVTLKQQKSFSLFFRKGDQYLKSTLPDLQSNLEQVESNNEPIVYRDGFGNIIPEEDLILREKAFESLKDRFISKVTYFSTGRDGYLIFTEGEKTARFEMEMGGGNCMFFILLPSDSHWEKHTGFPLEEKTRIADHIARMTQRDQAGGARYSILENEIIYYRK